MGATTYGPTDLQRQYRAILDEAKAGEARVRDLDGTSILLVPESEVQVLRRVSATAAGLVLIERVLEQMATSRPDVSQYGDWIWLHAFDEADLREFVGDIREAIIVAVREGSSALLDEQLRAWRITARQGDDPVFRAILRSGAPEEEFVEVRRPEGHRADDTGGARATG